MSLGGAASKNLVRFGDGFELDPQTYELRRSGQALKLERIPVGVLLLLIEHQGQLVRREQIVERVWGKDVFLDTDNSINAAIRKIRHALGDDPEHPRFVETLTGRGYRFVAPIEEVTPSTPSTVQTASSGGANGNGTHASHEDLSPVGLSAPNAETKPLAQSVSSKPLTSLSLLIAGAVIVAVVLLFAGLYIRKVHANRLQPDDTIVLGDFANSTGDPIFDDTLKQGLTLTLQQSPFLNILPQSKISKTLRLMTRDPGTPLTPAVVNEVCQRAGSKAYVAGAIGSLGSEYVLGLKAINCHSGDVLAQEQVTAARKEQVLVMLGAAATRLRSELGESLATVQKFDVPLTEATTPSLEALREYSQGLRIWYFQGELDAIPHLKRAIELDSSFASAYSSLGTVYRNLEFREQAAEYMTKAYELRDRASEREKLYILGHYYADATGELEKAIPAYKQWIEEYPSEPTPHTNLANIYTQLGHIEDSLPQHLEALRLEPNGVLIHENLAMTYSYLNRFDEADAMVQRAFDRKLDDVTLHLLQVQLAYVRGNVATALQKAEWGIGKPGVDDSFLAMRSDIEAAMGRLKKSRESTRLAVASAIKSGSKETAAYWQANGALHEADLGNAQEAVKQADAALALSRDLNTLIFAGLVMARSGKTERAKAIAEQLDHDRPHSTLMRFYLLPAVRAMMDLHRGDGAAAIQTLQPAAPYEMSMSPPWQSMGPIYLRAEALLQLHQGTEAAVEFKKVLAHPGLVEFWSGSLANLELGRAYAMAGDTANAKKSYEDFFKHWKDADDDIPILKSAKVEYAKLEKSRPN